MNNQDLKSKAFKEHVKEVEFAVDRLGEDVETAKIVCNEYIQKSSLRYIEKIKEIDNEL